LQFDWSPIPHEDWRALLARAPRANLLQSWPYAVAARLHDQMMSRRGLILDAGAPIGVMQIQEIRIGPVHVLRLHRGPLWLDGEPGRDHWRAFLEAFSREFPRRLGRWRHLLPECDDSEAMRGLLADAGWRHRGGEPYHTILVELTPPLDEIRRRFKSNWRNKLRQGERSGLDIRADSTGATTSTFLAGYAADKSARRYRGPKPARLATLIASASPAGEVLMLNAAQDGATVAAMLMFRHGNAATYQAGWTSEAGRQSRAHHLLLWNAIGRLKAAGVAVLDLGGVNPHMAEGVTRFKEGLGGRLVTLPGLFG
jgi:hypothetical protein